MRTLEQAIAEFKAEQARLEQQRLDEERRRREEIEARQQLVAEQFGVLIGRRYDLAPDAIAWRAAAETGGGTYVLSATFGQSGHIRLVNLVMLEKNAIVIQRLNGPDEQWQSWNRHNYSITYDNLIAAVVHAVENEEDDSLPF